MNIVETVKPDEVMQKLDTSLSNEFDKPKKLVNRQKRRCARKKNKGRGN